MRSFQDLIPVAGVQRSEPWTLAVAPYFEIAGPDDALRYITMARKPSNEGLGDDQKTRLDCFAAIEQQLHALERFSTPAEIDAVLIQIRAQLRLLQRKLDHGGGQPI